MTEPNISIGIMTEKEIRFVLYGEFTAEKADKKFSGRFRASIQDNKIRIVQDQKEVYSSSEIIFSPNDIESESFLIRDVIIGKDFHWERKEDQRFLGVLKLILDKNLITVINILPLEEYLTSVISSEMSANSSLELLRAHSVISRGWILAQLNKKNNKSVSEFISENEIIRWYDRENHSKFDFCADDHCQRYQGITKIINDNANNAISATRGLVLKSGGEICDTRYSKCCGGISESFENVWEPTLYQYLTAIKDYKFGVDSTNLDLRDEKQAERWINSSPQSFCNTSDEKILSTVLMNFDYSTKNFFRWKVEYSQEELSELINSKLKIDFGKIIDLFPVERGYSARISRLKIVGTKKSITIGKELEIRRALSKTHLYSSAFTVTKENIVDKLPQKFILNGAGWGHGVGLCQIGAAVMGELGYSFDEILTHYFKNTQIQKLY